MIMNGRRFLIFLLAAALGGLAIFLAIPSRSELVVNGKPVSEWALALAGPAPTEPARAVIQKFGPEAVPDLVRMLRTKDSLFARPVRVLGPKLPRRLHARLRRLFQVDHTVQRRYTAAMALGLMGTNAAPALPALVQALRDETMTVSMTAALDLGRLGTISLPGLMSALADPSVTARRAAMTGLIQLGPAAADAVPKLVNLLKDPADRPMARMALQAMGKPAVPHLAQQLNDPAEESRLDAIEILGQIGWLAREVIPALREAARDRSPAVRSKAITALFQICQRCDPVVSTLQNALDDEHQAVRRLAARHLSADPQTASKTVQMLLRKVAEDGSDAKQRAISSLGLIGPKAREAVPALRTLAEGDNSIESALAREALERIVSAPARDESVPARP
jgi:HEAT repeat protein